MLFGQIQEAADVAVNETRNGNFDRCLSLHRERGEQECAECFHLRRLHPANLDRSDAARDDRDFPGGGGHFEKAVFIEAHRDAPDHVAVHIYFHLLAGHIA